jgi:hypothetical protein
VQGDFNPASGREIKVAASANKVIRGTYDIILLWWGTFLTVNTDFSISFKQELPLQLISQRQTGLQVHPSPHVTDSSLD